jgi:hypothetical protein
VAAILRDYLSGKAVNARVWAGTWAKDHRGAEMLRADLEAAGIPYAVEGPDGPEYADFHALRHSYLTLGGRAGIDLRTLQELAGHSTPTLTARYMHVRLRDAAGAVDKMPNLVPVGPTAGQVPLRRTGTDDARAVPPAVPPAVPDGYGKPHQSAPKSTSGTVAGPSELLVQPLEMQGAGTFRHRPASICSARATGLEPATTGSTVRYSNQLSYAPISSHIFLHRTPATDKTVAAQNRFALPDGRGIGTTRAAQPARFAPAPRIACVPRFRG